MADPHSCPDYDESFDRPYHIPSAIALSGDIDDAETFADRIESELNGRGIKVERTEEVVEEAPDWF